MGRNWLFRNLQERMAVVLAPKSVEAFCQAAAEENLNAQVVAIVSGGATPQDGVARGYDCQHCAYS